MRKTVGFLIVLFFAQLQLAVVANAADGHTAHLNAAYGPQVTCSVCHNAHGDLFITEACDPCHSPGGIYDGVNDPVIGAKANWEAGVYNGSELAAGKEKWCVGCHDDIPSEVNGVSAPVISGDDTTYGYYKTGHGKHGNQQAITCLACHDPALMHVDGEARTYAAAADNYQAGYRLKSVDGMEPMDVPRLGTTGYWDFRLCISCHDSTPFLTRENTDTNFRSDVNNNCEPLDPATDWVNMHYYHLQSVSGTAFKKWDSDWNGWIDSWISCPACHNVHGPKLSDGPAITNAPGMIRTGELIGRSRSLNLDYFADTCSDRTLSSTNELSSSTGGEMRFYWAGRGDIAKNGVCLMCHNEREPYWREAKDILSCEKCHGSVQHTATPGSDYVLIFAEGDHDDVMEGDGEVYVACQTCHSTELGAVHANQCSTCHPSPYDTLDPWTGGCQQGGCHTTYHDDASEKHWTVDDQCTQCHDAGWNVPASSCANCHTVFNPNDTVPPVTTSDAQASYVGLARIDFSITDSGKVGVGTTFYRVDGGASQTGPNALITSSGSHSLEFWSVDQAGNVESPPNTANFTIAPDTTPPVTTSNAQSSYFGIPANITLTATDNGTYGVKTTYYKLNGGPTQTGTSVYVAKQPGTSSYTLEFWSEDWSDLEEQPHNFADFEVTGGTGTLQLVWGDSDISGSPCILDPAAEAVWTIRKDGSGPIVATGSGACPDWSGVDDVVVQVSLTPYSVSIDWWDSYWDWWDNTYFPNVEVSTDGQVERLQY